MVMLMLIRMAFRAICHHALRSLLTLLGIVIGIAGIVAISAVGKGAQKKARDQYLAYGSKSIQVYGFNWMAPTSKPSKSLTIDDLEIIMAQCPAVQYVSPYLSANQIAVEYVGNKSSAKIKGTNEKYIFIAQRELQQGMFFSQEHVKHKENVVVLSPAMAEIFFKFKSPLGAIVCINKIPFTVIGVLASPTVKGRWDGVGLPELFIPFTCHQKYFGNRIEALTLSTYADEQVAEVTRQLEKIFRAAHRLEEAEPNDFMIYDSQTFAAAAQEAAKSVGLFALVAAVIALLVGGIGVMNIMLVAVQERTKEIGIKAALGATMNVIRIQFLIEAIVICMIGGVIGVVCGIAVAFILDYWGSLATIIEVTPIVVAFFCTVLIGIVFGFYPAEKAARLNPVQALTEQ